MSSDTEQRVVTPSREIEETSSVTLRDIIVAGIAGLIGMLAMMPLFGVGYLFGVIQLEAFAGLATIVGLGPSFPIGLVIFIGGGTTTLPLLFITLGNYLPPGKSIALRGMTFATIMWCGFLIAFYTGQAGLTLVAYLGLTLVAHWVYGFILGSLTNKYASIAVYDL
ncbi:DUF6789 family protein [Natronocalculus amylovorans]|uniref:Cytochrome C oxidase subunit I n=1 Tax=Natronocalculus amylovorans TaxID=2917812 RepID=A0AAE3FZA2_9EURY|nr:DUF6789 family protein [Natronocalculus amylovorans]MCL9817896.1 hypothetical protein [Natronocalculus amylovorans]NUE03169.1 hypothetical protein [Halorubraceae archaeon YAN]